MDGNKFPTNFSMQISSLINGEQTYYCYVAPERISSEVSAPVPAYSDSSSTTDGPPSWHGFPGVKLSKGKEFRGLKSKLPEDHFPPMKFISSSSAEASTTCPNHRRAVSEQVKVQRE